MSSNGITTLSQGEISTLIASDRNFDPVQVRLHPERYPRIGKTDPAVARKVMREIVIRAYLIRGQQADDDAIDFIADNLLAELTDPNNRYGMQYLAWCEVARAIRSGLLGEGKEMYGISVASLYQSILEYVKGEGHRASQKAIAQRKQDKALPSHVKAAIGAMAVDLADALKEKSKEAGL